MQPNIHRVTDAVYTLFRSRGYDDDRILYLATESRPGRDGLATTANLQAAITTWAVDKVGPDWALTLYLMDHGTTDLIYLDKPSHQWVSPAQLHEWLGQLEIARPGVKINLIVEACNSGGFVDAPQTASGPGRVVITSTSPDKLAWASEAGAVFSDHFLGTLGQGATLHSAFQAAAWAVQQTGNLQEPWLDGNGNGVPNEPRDAAEAARRGFAYAGTLADDRWPPYIAQADPIRIDDAGRGQAFQPGRAWPGAQCYPRRGQQSCPTGCKGEPRRQLAASTTAGITWSPLTVASFRRRQPCGSSRGVSARPELPTFSTVGNSGHSWFEQFLRQLLDVIRCETELRKNRSRGRRGAEAIDTEDVAMRANPAVPAQADARLHCQPCLDVGQ